MSLVWREGPDLLLRPPGPAGVARAVLRSVPMLLLLVSGLVAVLALRPFERLVAHPRRPLTPAVAVAVSRGCLRLTGLRVERRGRPMTAPGAVVANHSSWLDILVLNAGQRLVFVAKAEVAGWPGIGWLARATGTLFIRRESRSEAGAQAAAIAARIEAGDRPLFFPEGTSTDGRRVLPFKPALFAGLTGPGLPPGAALQPVTLAWEAPGGEDPRFYGWWGGAGFGPSALAILASRRPGAVRVIYHDPIPVAAADRKALAQRAHAAVARGLGEAGVSP